MLSEFYILLTEADLRDFLNDNSWFHGGRNSFITGQEVAVQVIDTSSLFRF